MIDGRGHVLSANVLKVWDVFFGAFYAGGSTFISAFKNI